MITDVNPFVYSRPVPPEDVLDRDAEVAELLGKAVGGHYVRLYAPRKYGKTSLLNRVLRDAERDEGLDPRPRRGIPPAHRPRPLARGVRDQRQDPARSEDRAARRAARAARPAA